MTWMLTNTGVKFDLRCVALDDIRIQDIAHHLALTNRWTGATRRPYSVAEHSLLVAEILEREHGITSPSVLLAGLLHDAHEAYTGDLSTPMKQVIGDAWYTEERRIQRALQRRFDILTPSAAFAEPIKRADEQALACEWRDLIGLEHLGRPAIASAPTWIDLRTRAGMAWDDWRQAYLDRFTELTYFRALQVAAAEGAEADGGFEGRAS